MLHMEIEECARCESDIVEGAMDRSYHKFSFDIRNDDGEYEQHIWTLCQTCMNELVEWVEGEFDGENPPDIGYIEYILENIKDDIDDIDELIKEVKE